MSGIIDDSNKILIERTFVDIGNSSTRFTRIYALDEFGAVVATSDFIDDGSAYTVVGPIESGSAGVVIAAGTSISVSYDGPTNTYTITNALPATTEIVQDRVALGFSSGTHDGISITYDDVGNAFDFVNTDKGSVAVSAHEAALDPHSQYATDTDLSSGLASKYDASNPSGYQTAAQVNATVQAVVGAAPAALDTLVELSAALGNDANFASTVTTSLAGKEPTIAAGTTAQYWRGDKTWQDLGAAVRSVLLTGYTVGANAALGTTDTILQAFGKIQAQINAAIASIATKANSAITISAGTSLGGGGDLTANRTISHNNFGAAGTYGSATSVPVITTEATGHVNSATNTPIAIPSSQVTNFNAAAIAAPLTGFTAAPGDVVATDTILQALQKIVGVQNQWYEETNTATQTNSSTVTGVAISALSVPVTSGKKYLIEWTICYTSSSTGGGLALGVTNSGAAGTFGCIINIPLSGSGTAGLFSGDVVSFNTYITASSTSAGASVAKMSMLFNCTASGTVSPIFRSENGSTITIQVPSVVLAREF